MYIVVVSHPISLPLEIAPIGTVDLTGHLRMC